MKKKFLFDIVYILFVALFAYMATQGSIDISCHGVAIDSDLQTYAQSLARDKYPDFFTTDPVMHIEDNSSVIPNIETYLASKLSSDEPAIGLLRAGGISLFLFFVLWYAFGIWLLRSRTLAALLALFASVTVWVGWGTFWGMLHSDPVPRSVYAALWPLLLLLGALACRSPMLRPATMLIAGISIWVHGISALCSGAMLASAFAFIRDKRKNFRAHITIFAVSVSLFLIPVCIYLSSTFFSDKIISIEDRHIIQTVFNIRWKQDYSSNLQSMLDILSHTNIIPYLFITGLLVSFKNLYSRNNNIVIVTKMYYLFLIGIFLTAIISSVEAYIAHKTNRIPLGHELIRGIRFIVPLSIIMIFCYINNLIYHTSKYFKVFILILCFSIVFFISKDKQIVAVQHYISQNLHISLPSSKYANTIKDQAYDEYIAVKQVSKISSKNELIFTPDEVLQLRYMALRPIVYTFKEGYIYYYRKDIDGMKYWLMYNNILNDSEEGYIKAWKQSGTRLMLCSASRNINQLINHGDIIWRNNTWIIAKIKQ